MKCNECKACEHELCTIGIYPFIQSKSKKLGCALNGIQVDYYRKQKAPTGRDLINQMDNKTFEFYFLDAVCDYVQEQEKEWCNKQEKCTGCIEKWLKEKHLKDS